MKPARLLFGLVLGRRLPQTQGTLRLTGPKARLRIHRDRWGIPYIEASNDHDAHFGVGFCHGQDRTFQLEVLLRAVRGIVSELVGPDGLEIDRLSRRIGFHRSSLEQEKVLDAEVRAILEAYARGVNAGTTDGLPRRPHEFVLLGGRPTPWTVADSLGVLKLLSFSLSSNWDAELARLKILTEDGPEALAALDPSVAPWLALALPPGRETAAAVDRLSEDVALFGELAPMKGASNNWVLAGWRTTTGRPLLANDPHLDARLPCHWYLAQVRTPEWAAAGATFLGGPTVASGHNGFAAWGMTAGLVDNTDLYREQISPDGRHVREGDEFVPCPVLEEVIHVKGRPDVVERVPMTPRGPIISPVLDGTTNEALSLRAVWLEPRPLRGMLCLHRARSFAEFRAACALWPAMSQNLVYADTSGTIGYQMLGEAPKRKRGWGTLPLPGWDPAFGWEPDLAPFETMPYAVDPPEGFLATANTRPAADGTAFLGVDWLDSYRLAAINRALENPAQKWSVSLTQKLQMSQEALPWQEIAEIVLRLPARDGDARLGQELLQFWDGHVTTDSPSATVYELFLAEMVVRLSRSRAPKSYEWALGARGCVITDHTLFCFRRIGHLVRLVREQPAGWFERSWAEEMADALGAVVRRLRQAHGPYPDDWTWGQVRKLVLRHPLGRIRWLAPIFNSAPVPCGGDTDTINQAAVLPLTPLAPANNIASLRTAIDVGAWDNSRFVVPGGQSGNPLSPHYDDLFEPWQRGEGVPIAWEPGEIAKVTVATLELEPN